MLNMSCIYLLVYYSSRQQNCKGYIHESPPVCAPPAPATSYCVIGGTSYCVR